MVGTIPTGKPDNVGRVGVGVGVDASPSPGREVIGIPHPVNEKAARGTRCPASPSGKSDRAALQLSIHTPSGAAGHLAKEKSDGNPR
jgi:hypothetical protein